jgi:chorismate dehydratase
VAAVSYLNTKPLLFGIRKHPIFNEIELVEDYPSRIAQMLIEDQVDIGLIPVTATLRLSEWHIAAEYCIGSNGPVASVGIFSEVPMDTIEKVYLDYQSRTSVNLAKILLRDYWKKNVELIDATGEDFRDEIKGTVAGVIIGDRALHQRVKSRYVFDLAEAWKNYTGLPFVFAAWISNKPLPVSFTSAFNEANELGLRHIDDVISENPFPDFDLRKYYRQCISYRLDNDKKMGMNLFLEKLKNFK